MLLLVATLGACGGTPRLQPDASGVVRYQAEGLASWYGEELAGRPTASGERFAPGGLTAAHRLLPLGTMVEVTAVASGRSVVVRINDRGPYSGGRIIDLSRGAAQLLGVDRGGPARVRLRALPPGARAGLARGGPLNRATASVPAEGRYWLQVASFADEGRARTLAERLGGHAVPAGQLWRVRVGPLPDARAAQRARDAVVAQGYADAQLIPIP